MSDIARRPAVADCNLRLLAASYIAIYLHEDLESVTRGVPLSDSTWLVRVGAGATNGTTPHFAAVKSGDPVNAAEETWVCTARAASVSGKVAVLWNGVGLLASEPMRARLGAELVALTGRFAFPSHGLVPMLISEPTAFM